MLGNILQTKCMVLEPIGLVMDIGMREPGMREEGRDLVYTPSGMGRHILVTGKMGFLTFLARNLPILKLPMLSTIPKFLVQSRYCGFFPCEKMLLCNENHHMK
jgi:hypothetical protein